MTNTQYQEAVRHMQETFRKADARNKAIDEEKRTTGTIRKFIGDEFTAVFRRANEAYKAAVAYRASIGDPVPEYVPQAKPRAIIGKLKLIRIAA
jgi:class 3 adenylate cyclase